MSFKISFGNISIMVKRCHVQCVVVWGCLGVLEAPGFTQLSKRKSAACFKKPRTGLLLDAIFDELLVYFNAKIKGEFLAIISKGDRLQLGAFSCF